MCPPLPPNGNCYVPEIGVTQAKLALAGYCTVRFNFRGVGASEGATYFRSPLRECEDVRDVARWLHASRKHHGLPPLESVWILGVAYGSAIGAAAAGLFDEFAGYVFKMQATLDPKHRDCMAYVRIVSGKFTKGMKVTHARTGRPLTLATAAMLFGSGKDTIQDAFPGDIIGLNNPAGGLFQIGDALHSGAAAVAFEPIPSFSPECFGYLRPTEVGASKKSFQKGVDQLLAEGAVQRLKQRGSGDGEDPLLAAVGELQFEVVVDRMQGEYGVACAIERVALLSSPHACR